MHQALDLLAVIDLDGIFACLPRAASAPAQSASCRDGITAHLQPGICKPWIRQPRVVLVIQG